MAKKALPALFVSFIFFYILSSILVGLFFSKNGDPALTVQQVEKVSPTFQELDEKVFNDNALNPTELIEIKESNSGSIFSVGEDIEDEAEQAGE